MSPISKFFEARRRRLAIRDLKALPPEVLRDIGIEPDRIATVAAASSGDKGPRKPPPLRGPAFADSAWPYPWRRAR